MTGTALNDWLVMAQNDLAAAQTMLATGGQDLYLQIGLQCHNALRKVATAAYLRHNGSTEPPADGSLQDLLADLPWRADLDARMLQTIEWLAAYPLLDAMDASDRGDLAALLTQDRTADLLARTTELAAWIQAKL